MTKWLASVQSLEEVQNLLPTLPDILDIKNPSEGALGALEANKVTEIVSLVAGRCQTSATVGDLAIDDSNISAAMTEMALSGVDYIKIGLFPTANLVQAIAELEQTVTSLPVPVIAVLFADNMPDQSVIPPLASAGFYGVMVDTAFKNGQHLRSHWSITEIEAFVRSVQHHQLLCGLAGALRQQDIAELQVIGADYLGFRSALCEGQQRTAQLSAQLAQDVQQLIQYGDTLKKAI